MSTYASLDNRFDRSMFIVMSYMHDNGRRDFLSDLSKLIAMFHVQTDEFCSVYKGHNIIILGGSNSRKIQKINEEDASALIDFECAFGSEIITEGRYEWKIRVNKFKYPSEHFWHLFLGVMNTKVINVSDCDYPIQSGCYSFDVSKGNVVNQNETNQQFQTKVTKMGDIVDILLDLENKRVSCKINGEDIGKVIKDLDDGEYRLD